MREHDLESRLRTAEQRIEALEEQLLEERRYHTLVEELPAIVAVIQPDGGVSYANRAACRLLTSVGGQDPGAAGGMRFDEQTTEDLRRAGAATNPLNPVSLFISSVDHEGHQLWIEWAMKEIFAESNARRRYLAVGFDITEKRKNEKDLLASRETAQDASRAKSEFLANMSHEIRTPLNGVLGMLQLLETTELDGEQREYASAAVKSAERLTQLLSDILDLTRVEVGKLRLNPSPFSLKETVVDICQLFELTAKQSGLELSCHVDPDLPEWVDGDRMRVQQILNNLVGNSVKFTHAGKVGLEVYRQLPPDSEQFRILFIVSDTGIGIPDEKIDFLFRPFTQVSAGYTRQFEGAGLGLAICKHLVGMMKGNLSIQSEAGQGTVIAVSLPMRPVETHKTAVAIPPSPLPPSVRLSVLVVEDDYVNCYAMRTMLEQSGFSVRTAGNGRDALEELRHGAFEIVLMDIQMPEMNGIEATRAIREGRGGARHITVPIIAMTAYAMPGDREKMLEAGLNGYVAKPLTKPVLLDAIAEALTAGGIM